MRFALLSVIALPLSGCLGLMAEGQNPQQAAQNDQFVETTKRGFVDCLHANTPRYAGTKDSAADVGTAVLGACSVQGQAWKRAVYTHCRASGNAGLLVNDPQVDAGCRETVADFEPKLKDIATSLVVSYRASTQK